MLARRYQCALFSPQGRILLSMDMRGWVFLVLPVLLVALGSANYLLYRSYLDSTRTRQTLSEMSEARSAGNEHLLRSLSRLREMEQDLNLLADFNAKLRIMLDMDSDEDRLSTLRTRPAAQPGLPHLPALFGRTLVRQIRETADRLGERMSVEEVRQQEIAHSVQQQMEHLATIPVIMPTRGRFSSAFGWRRDPFKGSRRFHKGIDITARTGTPIRAAANGFVTSATRSESYGLVIVITHSEEITTRYAHMSRFAVKPGDRVLRGQLIGHVGNTGRSKAPHLHYEVFYQGRPVNPRNYILQ